MQSLMVAAGCQHVILDIHIYAGDLEVCIRKMELLPKDILKIFSTEFGT